MKSRIKGFPGEVLSTMENGGESRPAKIVGFFFWGIVIVFVMIAAGLSMLWYGIKRILGIKPR